MTPNSPRSSDGSALPARHRPNVGNLAKDTTELDLWAFDAAESPPAEPATPTPKTVEPLIPSPRFGGGKNRTLRVGDDTPPTTRLPGKQDSIRTNIGAKKSHLPSGQPASQMPALSEFGDLDHWEDVDSTPAASLPVLAPVAPMPVPRESERPSAPVNPPVPTAEVVAEASPSEPVAAVPAAPEKSDPESAQEPLPQTSADKPKVSLIPRMGLSKFESLGLAVFGGLLLVVGGVVYFNTVHRLPREVENVESADFPIAGSHVTLQAVESHWREPILEGPDADTFRRDTVVLPEVLVTASGKAGALRLFFRDGEGKAVGDAVTRTVHPGEKTRFTATAGFEDQGMLAAYRIGKGKRWTIDVWEAPSEQSTEFRKLFTMNVSSDHHQ
jgi:hypothetical protein